jgi:hypothetical protein
MRRATTAAEVQRCIDELAREGLEDAGLVAEAARLLEARQLVEEKRRRREAAAARAQKDLDEFIGMSGLQCSGCSKRKLHREFLQHPLTERCDHLQQHCMRCVKSCLDNRMVCPEAGCRAVVTEEELLSVDNMLRDLFPEDLTGGGVDMFRVTTSFLERSGSGRDNVQIRQLTGESIMLQCSCAEDTVAEFKTLIEEQIGTPASKLRLVCRGTELADPMSNLQHYGVENGSIVNMMVLMVAFQSVKDVLFNLGWTFPTSGQDYLDGSCLMFYKNAATQPECVDYQLKETPGVTHSGDVMTKATGSHTIDVSLEQIPEDITRLFFTLSAFNAPDIQAFRSPTVSLQVQSNGSFVAHSS